MMTTQQLDTVYQLYHTSLKCIMNHLVPISEVEQLYMRRLSMHVKLLCFMATQLKEISMFIR